MTTVLVTGGSGFIGRALVRRLENDGYSVNALSSKAGDIAEPATLDKLPPSSVVFHLASRSYVPDSWHQTSDFMHVNVLGTQNIIDYCRRHGARLVFASSYIYGQPMSVQVSEDHPIHPNNPYAISKHLGEQLCEFAARYQGVTATVLRVFNVFGPGQRQEFLIPTMLDQIKHGEKICVKDLRPRRDYIYLNDVVDAFVLAGEIGSGFNTVNVGSGQSHSVAELLETAQLVAGTDLPVVSEDAPRQQEILDVVADCSLAKTLLGWSPRYSLLAGFGEMLKSDINV